MFLATPLFFNKKLYFKNVDFLRHAQDEFPIKQILLKEKFFVGFFRT